MRDYTKIFLAVLLSVFIAEHVWLVTRPSPTTVDPTIISCRVVK